MRLAVYRDISDGGLRRAWSAMQEGDAGMSPFLKLDYVANVMRYTRLCYPMHASRIAAVCDDAGEILMIAPVRVDRIGGKMRMMCDLLGAGKAGFLYSPALSERERCECLDFFFANAFLSKGLKLRRLDPASPEHRWLSRRYGAQACSAIPCVAIDCSGGYDGWMSSLSKSARQNLRTARNRAARDGVELSLRVWGRGEHPEARAFSQLTRLYVERLYTKYRRGKGGFIGRLIHRRITIPFKYFVTRRLKHDTRSLAENSDAVTYALYAGGELMAAMSGFVTASGDTITVPRLSINDKFSFYSPGCLLIAEAIRSTPGLRTLDLSRGVERYKFDMGGAEYETSSWTITRDKR